jgi:antitoxin component YwqK of YwqJK toxin-antitoxin module
MSRLKKIIFPFSLQFIAAAASRKAHAPVVFEPAGPGEIRGKQGKEIVKYENDIVRSEIEWLDGLKNGAEKHYDESGKLMLIIHWQAGKKNGIEKNYYSGGYIKNMSHWKNGKLMAAAEYSLDGKETTWVPFQLGIS